MKKNRRLTKKSQAKEFDKLVCQAQQKHSVFIDDPSTRYEMKMLLRFMPDLSSSTLLDVGCGTGRFSVRLAKYAKRIVGIDTSGYSIKTFRDEVKKTHLNNISARVIDFHDLPDHKKFDYILMVNVVHHVPDIKSLLNKVQKVLRKNGTLIIYEFNPINPLYIPFLIRNKQASMHMNKEYFRSNIWSLGKIFNQSNYTLVRKFRHGFLPTILYNRSPFFIKINGLLNSVPMLNQFCAFHILAYKIRTNE